MINQYPFCFQDEGGGHLESLPGGEDNRPNGFAGSSPSIPLQSAVGPKKKRHRVPKEKEREAPVRDSRGREAPSSAGVTIYTSVRTNM